jgi:dihydroorotate dehydrogenase electron transfer subunit
VHDLTAPLVARRRVSGRMWVLRFAAGEIASEVRGGQFVNLLLRPGPLLRRPFSVWQASPEEGWVEVLLEAVGVGTRLLVALCDGEAVSMLGPLGNGYTLDAGAGSVALLSGGLGVAPMAITARDAHTLGLRVHWVHGARSEDELCTEWEGDRVHWATDDGTRGHRGTALDAVPDGVGQILACGPNPMLAAVAGRWPQAQVAVETYMGCGTGVCLGCAVPRTSGIYDRACTEGPVYPAATVRWSELPGRLQYEGRLVHQ